MRFWYVAVHSAHHDLSNDVFMTQLDYVFMEKSAYGNLRSGESLAGLLCIWRSQIKLHGPRERGNIVEGSVDGCYALGWLRFHE